VPPTSHIDILLNGCLLSKLVNLNPALDAIEAFGFWLKHAKPGWSISRPEVDYLETGERFPIFVLYYEGVLVGAYRTPLDALAIVEDVALTQEYLSLVSDADDVPSDDKH
jgi:hypothetical protein